MQKRLYVRVVVSFVVCYISVAFVIWCRSAPLVSGHTNRDRPEPVLGNKDHAFTPVVIVAYMRSGSSLTGNLIQQDPDVFYVFEPLHGLIREYQKEKMKQFSNAQFLAERPLMIVMWQGFTSYYVEDPKLPLQTLCHAQGNPVNTMDLLKTIWHTKQRLFQEEI